MLFNAIFVKNSVTKAVSSAMSLKGKFIIIPVAGSYMICLLFFERKFLNLLDYNCYLMVIIINLFYFLAERSSH